MLLLSWSICSHCRQDLSHSMYSCTATRDACMRMQIHSPIVPAICKAGIDIRGKSNNANENENMLPTRNAININGQRSARKSTEKKNWPSWLCNSVKAGNEIIPQGKGKRVTVQGSD